MHSFSLTVAKTYGDVAALIFGYLSYKIHRSKHHYDGKQWYYETLEEITKKYPYLKKTTIYDAIRRLTADDGLLVTGNYNKRGYDRTTWYAFRTKEARQLAGRRLAYFRVEDVYFRDIASAVLLSLIAYMIRENRKTKPDCYAHQMSPTELARILPYGESTIKRKLKKLVDDGPLFVISALDKDHREPAGYGFFDCEMLKDHYKAMELNPCAIPNKTAESLGHSRNGNLGGPNPDNVSSNPNEMGSIPDDDTMLENILENPFRKTVGKSGPLRCAPGPLSDTFKSCGVYDVINLDQSNKLEEPYKIVNLVKSDNVSKPDKELNMINNELQSVNNKESDKLWHLDHQGNVDYAKLMEDFRASVASYYARSTTDSRPQPN